MKFCKKATAAVLAAALCLSAAGCSGTDKSWAVKTDSKSIPIGCYIYNLYSSYQQASMKVSDTSKSVLEQKVENKDAKTWIRGEALSSTRELLLLDKKMSELKLTLSDADKKRVSDANSAAWSKYSANMEKYGIAQTSFEQSYGNAVVKEEKIFNAIYGKGGTKAVADSELKDFYVKNSTDFSFIVCTLYTQDSSGSTTAFTDKEKKNAEEILENYATQIKTGKLTMTKAAAAYKVLKKLSDEQLHTVKANFTGSSSYPEAMTTALKSMKAGEVKTLELKDQQMFILMQKDDSAKNAEAELKDEASRDSILQSCKTEEFLTDLKKEADAMTGITVNNKALDSYDPKMFETKS